MSDEKVWKRISEVPPPVGVVIQTKVSNSCGTSVEQELVFDDPLWFFPDHSMYVYYTPTHWR